VGLCEAFFGRSRRSIFELDPETLLEDLPDEPQMTKRVNDGALEHSPDRARSNCRVRVFAHWTVLNSSGGQSSVRPECH
jgi:hypothetical protein